MLKPDIDNWVTATLMDSSGDPLSGIVWNNPALAVYVGSGTWTQLTLTVDDWVELEDAVYQLRIPAAYVTSSVGMVYWSAVVGAGKTAYGADIVDGTTVTPVAAEVIEEGQLRDEYFPNCGSDAAMVATINRWITAACSAVKSNVGTTKWATTDSDAIQVIHDAVLFLTLARAWQVIKNVMDTYDAEELPPEFVEPEQAAANRDYYKGEANSLIAVIGDATPGPGAYVGTFDSTAATSTEPGWLGLSV